MKKSALLIIFLFFSAFLFADGWTLVWSDEFDRPGLPDAEVWGYEEGFIRNRELQYYTSRRQENVRVEDGLLVIEARKEKLKNPNYKPGSAQWKEAREFAEYTSGSLRSKRYWKYGRIEVRAKLPQGGGVWPAIWTLGENIKSVSWPKCGEIDILEFVGNEPDLIHATVHYGESGEDHHSSSGKLKVNRPFDDFHIYAIEWFEDRIDFFFDDVKYHTFLLDEAGPGPRNAFRKPHFLLFNFALGGDWGGSVEDSVLPQKYLIDYVRIYQSCGEK